MSRFKLQDLTPETVTPREQAELDRQAGVAQDGIVRRRKGRTHQVLYRCTPERKDQLKRLADALSGIKGIHVSYIDAINQALDALEREIKGTKP